jgi:STE24 endopeptidase
MSHETAPFDPEAETEAYLAKLTPEQRTRSDAYFEGGYWMDLWDFLLGLGIAWLFLGTRLSAALRDRIERRTSRPWLQTLLYSLTYILLSAVLTFPMTLYDDFFREHRYGLSNQTFAAWFKEMLIGLGVGLVLGGLALTVLYAVLRRTPRTWWLWGSAVGLVFAVLLSMIYPVFIAPLFNDFTPLKDQSLRADILSLARANGIPATDVYQVDASRQTKRVSANVSGFLGTMRISLNDNLLNRCSRAEIREVMGHEMGHYALNHVEEGLLFFGIVIVAGFAFLRWSFDRVTRGFGRAWGVRGVPDVAGMPLLSALLSVYFFVLTPVTNTQTRIDEAEADLFALNAAREPEGAAEIALKLGEYRKLAPGPWEERIFFDHPSGRSRILMAMRWKAEHLRDAPPPLTPPAP